MAVKDILTEREYILVVLIVVKTLFLLMISLVECEEHLFLDEARSELGRLPFPIFFFVRGLVLLTYLDELHVILI